MELYIRCLVVHVQNHRHARQKVRYPHIDDKFRAWCIVGMCS
jgi:hypothetical protein